MMTTTTQTAPAAAATAGGASAAFRSLLVHVQDFEAAQPRLDSAIALAERLDATLVGLGVEGIDPLVFSDGSGLSSGLLADYEAAVSADIERARALFERKAAGVRHAWLAMHSDPRPAMAALCRNVDLIVVGGGAARDKAAARTCDTGELVITAGRPLLVAPEAGGRLHAKAALVAWKDTREARRALADALPFLKDAEEVLVLEVCAQDEVEDAQARVSSVVAGLKRHGVAARGTTEVAHPDAAAFELNSAADAIGADLIVAGAYGHSRLGEWVLGGVTRELLLHTPRFILLSH